MGFRLFRIAVGVACLAASLSQLARAEAQAEQRATSPMRIPEGRAMIAVPGLKGGIHVNWRLLLQAELDEKFELFRGDEKVASINGYSSFLDPKGTSDSIYTLMYKGERIAATRVWASGYLPIKLDKPQARTTPEGEAYEYSANDAAIADLDGDGLWDIVVKWEPDRSKDNSQAGYSGETIIDGYSLNGKRLWRIDLGPNIRSGAHYTQFIVADFDGDQRAELMVKTADGTVDGTGKVLGDPSADWREASEAVRRSSVAGARTANQPNRIKRLAGRILSGPEFISVFDGPTGKALASERYKPFRGEQSDQITPAELKTIWGDDYGNRSERYLAALAFLDENKPSAIFSRGYYARSVITAWDWRDGRLTSRWVFDSSAPGNEGFGGQGNHQMSVADIDHDGRQEIIFGAMALDDDGSGLWTSGLLHGDAIHVGDFDTKRPGLERFGPHEVMSNGNIGAAMLDAETGEVLWSTPSERDTGRGAAFDIDPRHNGAEAWAVNDPRLFNAQGKPIAGNRPSSPNFAIWWDDDPLREILNGTQIFKWDWNRARMVEIFKPAGLASNNGTKATPALSADIFGDWREEVIFRTESSNWLVILATPIPTKIGHTTLLADPQYFSAVAWQNSGYNQPPHPSFDLASRVKNEKK